MSTNPFHWIGSNFITSCRPRQGKGQRTNGFMHHVLRSVVSTMAIRLLLFRTLPLWPSQPRVAALLVLLTLLTVLVLLLALVPMLTERFVVFALPLSCRSQHGYLSLSCARRDAPEAAESLRNKDRSTRSRR
ncbi:hypothetical protein FS749_006828 [Ceratobasidium sp. UAMH 11750]|nr:hypothetical protein FS749_006828 [Ceratobasidium sp. UAMH 11750]